MPTKTRSFKFGSVNIYEMLQRTYFLNTMRDSHTGEIIYLNGVNVRFNRGRRPYINANGGISTTIDRNTYEVMKIEFGPDLVYFTLTAIDENGQLIHRITPITDPTPGNILIIV